MPKGRNLTPYQKGIVRRYYENKDTLMSQKLAEIVSELGVCQDEKKAGRLWERARKALATMEVHPLKVNTICDKRDIQWLAELVGELF